MLDVDSRPDQVGGSPARGRRWRMPWFTTSQSLLILIGVLVLMYPNVSSWFSQYSQSLLIEDVVGADVEKNPPSRLEAEIAKAEAPGNDLTGGALLSPSSNVPTGQGEVEGDFDYNQLLSISGSGTMGRLKIPSIDVDLPIYRHQRCGLGEGRRSPARRRRCRSGECRSIRC